MCRLKPAPTQKRQLRRSVPVYTLVLPVQITDVAKSFSVFWREEPLTSLVLYWRGQSR